MGHIIYSGSTHLIIIIVKFNFIYTAKMPIDRGATEFGEEGNEGVVSKCADNHRGNQ